MAYYKHIFAIVGDIAYRTFNPKYFKDIITFSTHSKYPDIVLTDMTKYLNNGCSIIKVYHDKQYPNSQLRIFMNKPTWMWVCDDDVHLYGSIGFKKIRLVNDISKLTRSQRYIDLSNRLSYILNNS